MSKVLPLFKSHFSISKSILTLDVKEKENGPRSIIKLVQQYNIKLPFLIEDNFSSFLEAYTNFKEIDQHFVYGIRLTFCADVNDKSEESINTECKYVILFNNTQGYYDFIKIWNRAATDWFYYIPRADFSNIKPLWTNNLTLAVPFYDSFLFNNNMTCKNCIPSTEIVPEVYFLEKNDLPFDQNIANIVRKYAQDSEIVETQSIYYEKPDDFLPYLTMRCIGKRSVITKPQLDHMSSDSFNLINWKNRCGV